MAVTARAVFQAHVDGLPAGDFPLKVSWLLASAIGQRQENFTLANGNNTIAYPTGTQVFIFIPPTNNTAAFTLKGTAGDTGVTLHSTKASVLSIHDGTPLIINAGSQVTGCSLAFL